MLFQCSVGGDLYCRVVIGLLSIGRGVTLKIQVQRVQESIKKESDLKVFFGMRWGSFGCALGALFGSRGALWGSFGCL